MVVAPDQLGMDAALENEKLVCLRALSDWLDVADFDRVLMICDAPAEPTRAEREALDALLSLGAETIEVLAALDARDLSQSWRSGRRTTAKLIVRMN
jgi:hypothetical protein